MRSSPIATCSGSTQMLTFTTCPRIWSRSSEPHAPFSSRHSCVHLPRWHGCPGRSAAWPRSGPPAASVVGCVADVLWRLYGTPLQRAEGHLPLEREEPRLGMDGAASVGPGNRSDD